MKGIYVLAALAVISLSLVPMAAEESDGESYSIYYTVLGDVVAYGTQNDLNVPEVEAPNGYIFDGWYCLGEMIDPYTYEFESGRYDLVAHFTKIVPEPEPEDGGINWTPIAVFVVFAVAMSLVVWYVVTTKRES